MATDLVRVAPLPNRFSRDSIPSALPASLLPSPAVPCRPHPYPPASGQRQDKARVRLCRPHLPPHGIIGMPLLSSPALRPPRAWAPLSPASPRSTSSVVGKAPLLSSSTDAAQLPLLPSLVQSRSAGELQLRSKQSHGWSLPFLLTKRSTPTAPTLSRTGRSEGEASTPLKAIPWVVRSPL